jgi:phytanoyl-CoA hydroxylase
LLIVWTIIVPESVRQHTSIEPLVKIRQDGWAVVSDVLDTALLDEVRGDITRTFVYQLNRWELPAPQTWDRSALFKAMRALFAKSPSTFFATARVAQTLPSIMTLAGSKGMLKGLRQVGVTDPCFALIPNIVFMSTEFHIEGGYNQRPPHQDWLSMQGSLDGVVAWIPLHDVSANDYPLEVWDGTHLLGTMQSERSNCGTRIVAPRLPDAPPSRMYMRYGDVSCMSNFMVHQTGAGLPDAMRVSIVLRYNNLSEPSFIDRAYPMPSTLTVAREPVPGGAIGAETVSDFFRRQS